MKLLMVSDKISEVEGVCRYLMKNKVIVERMGVEYFRRYVGAGTVELSCDVILFDRVGEIWVDLMKISLPMEKFFLMDGLPTPSENLGRLADGVMRCYFWPLNYQLLLDDLQSIVGVKNYLLKDSLELGVLKLNLNRRVVGDGRAEVFLPNKEFELLLYLARNRGRVLSRNNILENVWDMNFIVSTNTVDVHVSKLRKILKASFDVDDMIKTVPCSGYILE